MFQRIGDPIYGVARRKTQRFLQYRGDEPLASAEVHALRVLTKKLRAYIRLYPEDSFYGAKRTNHALKILAQAFAGNRDAKVKADTVLRITRGDPHLLAQCEPLLTRWREQASASSQSPLAQEYASYLTEILHHWPNRDVSKKSAVTALRSRFKRTKKHGKRALALLSQPEHRAKANKSARHADVKLHKFRKSSKYHFYNLCAFADRPGKKHLKRLKKLNSLLGNYHDLCVLQYSLVDPAQTLGVAAPVVEDLLKRLSACKKADLGRIKKHYTTLYAGKSAKHIKIH